MAARKKILYINRKSPHGTIHAQEALDVALIGAAFDQDVSLAFIDDGVYQLLRGQDTGGIATKNFSATYRALGDFDIRQIFVDEESMTSRGLEHGDMLDIRWIDEDDGDSEKSAVHIVDTETLRDIIDKQDIVLSF